MPSPTPTPTPTPSPSVATRAPYAGAIAVPGIIQAENFDHGGQGVSYHDTTAGNSGGDYRNTDVDLRLSSDTGGTHQVGWTVPGEWLEYTIQVAQSGTYSLASRVAVPAEGSTFHVEINGTDVSGPITLQNTGSWDVFATIHTPGLALSAGEQVMRVVIDKAATNGYVGDFNWFELTEAAGPTPSPTPAPTPSPRRKGDANKDGKVNIQDFNVVLSTWGRAGQSDGDLNTDGTVNIYDLNLVLTDWGE